MQVSPDPAGRRSALFEGSALHCHSAEGQFAAGFLPHATDLQSGASPHDQCDPPQDPAARSHLPIFVYCILQGSSSYPPSELRTQKSAPLSYTEGRFSSREDGGYLRIFSLRYPMTFLF